MTQQRSRSAGRARRLGIVVLAAVAALGAVAPTAGAHAAFQDAAPEPGSRLESSPARIALAFTEPLDRRLTRATLVNATSGRPVPSAVTFEGRERLVLVPGGALRAAPYRVVWHTVSRLDGHALEGSVGFGVRSAPPGGGERLEQSPLARDGWLRIALRALLYVFLFVFAGGVLVGVVLSPARPAGWLAGHRLGGGRDVTRRAWRRTRVAGWIAVVAAFGVALVETRFALAVKAVIVGLVAVASYTHALRLRPGLLAGGRPPGLARERRHWRLLGIEPPLGVVILSAAALLAVFPLPPRQFLERAEAGGGARSAERAVRSPASNELAVAWHAGPWLAAAWIKRTSAGLEGAVRLFSPNLVAPHAAITIRGATSEPCASGPAIHVAVRTRHRRYAVALPASWRRQGEREARRLIDRATAVMRALRSLRVAERLSGGVGLPVTSRYRLQAPDRFVSVVHSRDVTRNVVVGSRSWFKEPRTGWKYETLGEPFDARGFFPWIGHLRGARLLRRGRLSEVALADPGGPYPRRPPFWFRLMIDPGTNRVVRMQMTAPGHFMTHRYFAFDAAGAIRPPR